MAIRNHIIQRVVALFLALASTTIVTRAGVSQSTAPDRSCAERSPASVAAARLTTGTVKVRSGRSILYQADAGWLRIGGNDRTDKLLADDGSQTKAALGDSPTAVLSYVAYFAQGGPAGKRPIMFVWEGGPGTATTSMVFSSFGPVLWNKQGGVDPNPDSLLDVTDLVFVDAPGTGFGHLEGCAPARSFYGVDQDAAAFRHFIQRFLSLHSRQSSPLYLFGESYGTLRAAVVAHRLEEAGTRVSGIVLSSQMLALDAWSDGSLSNPGTENAFFLSLPSFAAAAWVHDRVVRSGDLETWLRGVERFSFQEYAPALLEGADLAPERKEVLANKLAAYTGIPARTWLDANLRMEGTRFRSLLEAAQGKLIGREDTRIDGPAPAAAGSAVENDPALVVDRTPRHAAFQSYVRGTLQFGERQFTQFIDGPDTRWDMAHNTDENAFPDTYVNAGPDLVDAMKANPHLRVLLVGGYFDLATPYAGGPYLLQHLQLPDALRANLMWHEYPAAHDPYEDDPVRHDMHDRIATMIR